MTKKNPNKTRWSKLDASPKRNKRSKLGRITGVHENAPIFLQPLYEQYERVSRISTTVDEKTGETSESRQMEFLLDEEGRKIRKPPKEWAIGGWDIESHCYEHTCTKVHRAREAHERKECPDCEGCPACNPEHGDHWISAQLSVLRVPDIYIPYVAQLPDEELFGGVRQEGGRYVEFLNGERSLSVPERARCIALDGCIDRTMRFLMRHPCFFQRAFNTRGYVTPGTHTEECEARNRIKKNKKRCRGCLRVPFAPGVHTKKCRHERKLTKKDGTPCPGCSTIGTAWYSHFGGGYDINFALRWLSDQTSDASAAKNMILSHGDDDATRTEMMNAFEERYKYQAESLLSGATHIEVKICKLKEVFKLRRKQVSTRPLTKPPSTLQEDLRNSTSGAFPARVGLSLAREDLAASLSKAARHDYLGTAPAAPSQQASSSSGLRPDDYWLKGFLGRGLAPSGPLASVRETQEMLRIVCKAKVPIDGKMDPRTETALKAFQKKCNLAETGTVDRETSAAVRYMRSETMRAADAKEALCFRDSFRLVASSLSEAAKDFELRHPVTGEPLYKIEDIDVADPPPPDDPDYRRYCRVDTEVCVQLVTKFKDLIESLGGSLEMTASACAINLFRKRYLHDKVPRSRHMTGCKMLCPHCNLEQCNRECGTQSGKKPGENFEAHQKMLERHKKNMHRLCPTYPVGCFHFSAIAQSGHRHGGHVDVLRQRLDHGRCYDVNSLYPFSMLGPMPVGQMQRFMTLTPKERRREKKDSALRVAEDTWERQKKRTEEKAPTSPYWKNFIEKHGLDMATLEALFQIGAERDESDPNFDKFDSFKRIKRCGYVECIVTIPPGDHIPESYFPPLPIVRESGTSGEVLFWPTGTLYGWWCYEELRCLLEVPGARLQHVRQSVWFRGEPLFRGFIEELYGKRKNSEGAIKQLLKIIMNSSYGKSLQNPLKRRVIRLQPTEERPKGWLPTNPNPPLGDDFLWPWGTVQEYREAPFFMPQWGSLITARARTVLWRVAMRVERGEYGKGKHVSYGDTDSIFTTAKIDDLCNDKELGFLKLEYVLPEDKRKKRLEDLEAKWQKYQEKHAQSVATIESDQTLSDHNKKERVSRLKKRLRFYEKKHYRDEIASSKYESARPDGVISAEFFGPKLYVILDEKTGAEVKTVHKGTPQPSFEKLRRFIAGEELKAPARAPKAGSEIRNDFQFDPIVLTRTGRKMLWKKPKPGDGEIQHKRVHHHDPKGRGTTSPRHVRAEDELLLEESFRHRRWTTAAALYEEWTGHPLPQESTVPAQETAIAG